MAFSAFAVCAPGLEALTAAELTSVGIGSLATDRGGVVFESSLPGLAKALVHSRVATRILVRVASFRATSFAQLERHARAVAWDAWIGEASQARFRVTCRKSRLYHSDAVAERLASALQERVTGVAVLERASDDEEGDEATQLFIVRFDNDVCTISADAAGTPLHKRGYRLAVAKAPLRETLAAAMLQGASWSGDAALVDPMCGSGTIVIEAALIARGIAPGLERRFSAERWPASSVGVWTDVRDQARDAQRDRARVPLAGSDRDAGAIDAARTNATRAGVANDVEFHVAPLSAARAPTTTNGLLITNPPYGGRIGDASRLRDLYARLGQLARREFVGWKVAVLSGDRTRGRTLDRQLGLDMDIAWQSNNGGIPVRLLVRSPG